MKDHLLGSSDKALPTTIHSTRHFSVNAEATYRTPELSEYAERYVTRDATRAKRFCR